MSPVHNLYICLQKLTLCKGDNQLHVCGQPLCSVVDSYAYTRIILEYITTEKDM